MRRSSSCGARGLCLALVFSVFGLSVRAAPFAQWIVVRTTGGAELRIWGEGDEYDAVFESEDGHTVLFDEDQGTYVYAIKDDATGRLLPTSVALGEESCEAETLSSIPLHIRDTSIEAEEARQGRIQSIDARRGTSNRWQQRKNRPTSGRLRLRASSSSSSARTVVGLALLVDFPSESATGVTLAQEKHPGVTRDDIDNLFNAESFSKYGNVCSVRKYFEDASCGNLCYTNVVIGWIRMPFPRSHYDNSSLNCSECARPIIQEAFRQIRANPQYATLYEPLLRTLTLGDDSAPMAVNVFFAGETAMRWNYGLWAHSDTLGENNYGDAWYTVDGKRHRIKAYEITPVTTTPSIGTLCHESGHMVCDFPDLYHYSTTTNPEVGVGRFSLMHGTISDFNPQNFDPYLRMQAGWITPKELTDEKGKRSVTCDLSDVWKWSNPKNSHEYYLIENRRKKGHDETLPAEGILIWRCNESHSNTDSLYLKSLSGAAAYRRNNELSLEQADGLYELEQPNAKGDACDSWHCGNPSKNYGGRFCADSLPCARWEDGSDSGLYLSGFSTIGDTMEFYVGEAPDLDPGEDLHSDGPYPDLSFVIPSGRSWQSDVFLSTASKPNVPQTQFSAGSPILLSCGFKNSGDVESKGPFTIRFTLYGDGMKHIGEAEYRNTITLPASNLSWSWNASTFDMLQSLSCGHYILRIELDADDEITEADESDNVRDVSFTVTAKFKLTANPNGGKLSGECFGAKDGLNKLGRVTVVYGKTSHWKFGTATRSGYNFKGWFTERKGGVQVFDSEGVCIQGDYWATDKTWQFDGDLTVYAQWEVVASYTLTVRPNGGTFVGGSFKNFSPTGPATYTVKLGKSNYYKIGTAKRDGHVFKGWYTGPKAGSLVYTKNGNAYENSTAKYWKKIDGKALWQYKGDVTVYAHWEKISSAVAPAVAKYALQPTVESQVITMPCAVCGLGAETFDCVLQIYGDGVAVLYTDDWICYGEMRDGVGFFSGQIGDVLVVIGDAFACGTVSDHRMRNLPPLFDIIHGK